MSKRFFKNAWVITIFGGVCCMLLYDLIKGYPFLATIKNLPTLTLKFLQIPTPLWVIISVVIVLLLIRKFLKRNPKPKLTRTDFRGFTWEWEWYDNLGEWDIADLRPRCPHCAFLMVVNAAISQPYGECLHCQKTTSGLPDSDDVKQYIFDKVRGKNIEIETEIAKNEKALQVTNGTYDRLQKRKR